MENNLCILAYFDARNQLDLYEVVLKQDISKWIEEHKDFSVYEVLKTKEITKYFF